MDRMEEFLPRVRAYLVGRDWTDVPCMRGRTFEVAPLAQGEYNLNYRISAGGLRLVFRVNIGTQIQRRDQIVYEYRALKLLERSGAAPRPGGIVQADAPKNVRGGPGAVNSGPRRAGIWGLKKRADGGMVPGAPDHTAGELRLPWLHGNPGTGSHNKEKPWLRTITPPNPSRS